MLKINGKVFMNLQEAVQWLLDNNALPFQSSANYIANTEIGMGTIVNPSPAKVRIGSLIFFADSKVSTVIGLTENGFMVSDQYNDLVDDVVYVQNVALDASGHLIVSLSNGTDIDAGLVKQVTGFEINASQHLIVHYNDDTSTDLGAIFNGNISLSGNLSVSGSITGNSIVENMSNYTFTKTTDTADFTLETIFAGAVKNGNKLTLVAYMGITLHNASKTEISYAYDFNVPLSVGNKLYPTTVAGDPYVLDIKDFKFINTTRWQYDKVGTAIIEKTNDYGNNRAQLHFTLGWTLGDLTAEEKYVFRTEITFLLSDSLAS